MIRFFEKGQFLPISFGERLLAILGTFALLSMMVAYASKKAEANAPTSTLSIPDLRFAINAANERADRETAAKISSYFAPGKPVVAFIYPAIKNRNCTALRTMGLKPLAVQAADVTDLADLNSRKLLIRMRRNVVLRADGWVTQDGQPLVPTGTVGSELAICLQFSDDIPIYSKETPMMVDFYQSGPVFYGRTLNAYFRPTQN